MAHVRGHADLWQQVLVLGAIEQNKKGVLFLPLSGMHVRGAISHLNTLWSQFPCPLQTNRQSEHTLVLEQGPLVTEKENQPR